MSCQDQKSQIQFQWSFLIFWQVKFRNSWRRHARALMSTYEYYSQLPCSWNEHANHPAANKQVTCSLFKDPVPQCSPFRSSQDEDSNPPISPLRSGCVSFIMYNQTVNNIITTLCLFHRSAEDVARQPKLFYVSTSATTSTLQTASICYVSSTSLTTCTGR